MLAFCDQLNFVTAFLIRFNSCMLLFIFNIFPVAYFLGCALPNNYICHLTIPLK